MHLFLSLAAFGVFSAVTAQSGPAGATTCVAGYTCTYNSAYYSQCIPGTSGTTTTASSGTTTGSPTTTSTGPAPTGSQIRTVQDPVFHFYLQNKGGVPVLGPEASSGYFALGKTISLSGSSPLFLNLAPSSTSYQALTLNSTAVTTDWGLEGDTIITTSPRQLNFLACSSSDSTIYNVYLQTGNDMPTGTTCSLVTMHLPCLC
ncbi:hypothetical protein C8J56DRAFT_1121337 [Mycena floridula]|nr:hypothetical protein C8J56DRAFT_1121337 [Mycena floridula]